MSFFGSGGRGAAPSGQPNQQRLGELALEMEMVSDLYTRLTNACQQKCISTRYAEAELNKGESVCLDRCVAKYFAVNEVIQEQMQKQQQQQAGLRM